jgi:hypothetical protein
MNTARMFLSVYRLYRTCNPRRVAISAAWSAIRRG